MDTGIFCVSRLYPFKNPFIFFYPDTSGIASNRGGRRLEGFNRSILRFLDDLLMLIAAPVLVLFVILLGLVDTPGIDLSALVRHPFTGCAVVGDWHRLAAGIRDRLGIPVFRAGRRFGLFGCWLVCG